MVSVQKHDLEFFFKNLLTGCIDHKGIQDVEL